MSAPTLFTKGPTTSVMAKMPPDLLARLDAVCRREGLSRAAVVRRALLRDPDVSRPDDPTAAAS